MSIEFPQTNCYKDIPIPECPYSDRIPLVNHADPNFFCYSGVLNQLDRDLWNNQLNDRSFAIHYPPYNLINKPQNTSQCIVPDYNPLILSAKPEESYAYWSKYNSEYNCNNTFGYPMYPNQPMFWKFQQKIAQCDTKKPYQINNGLTLPNAQMMDNAIKQQPDRPWTNGIQRNIDVESKLFQLGYYNNLECYPNNIICNPKTPCLDNVAQSGPAILSNSPLWNQGKDDMILHPPPCSVYQRFNNLTKVKSLYSRG